MPDQKRDKGFTLIEVIAVLAIISILGIVAVLRMTSTSDADMMVKAETVRGHIRFTQMRAMNAEAEASGCPTSYGISFSGDSYFMFKNCDTNNKVILPGADASLVPIKVSPSGAIITFDKWGIPYSDSLGTTKYTVNKDLAIGTETIRITKNTGYVP